MAGTKKAGAKVPATMTVCGIEFTPNVEYAKSWQAFELNLVLSDENAAPMEKMAAYIELVEGMTGIGKEQLVEAAGGPTAPVTDVFNIMTEIVKACTPKA